MPWLGSRQGMSREIYRKADICEVPYFLTHRYVSRFRRPCWFDDNFSATQRIKQQRVSLTPQSAELHGPRSRWQIALVQNRGSTIWGVLELVPFLGWFKGNHKESQRKICATFVWTCVLIGDPADCGFLVGFPFIQGENGTLDRSTCPYHLTHCSPPSSWTLDTYCEDLFGGSNKLELCVANLGRYSLSFAKKEVHTPWG